MEGAMPLSGNEPFVRLLERLARQERRVAYFLEQTAATWFAKRNVIGFGVGQRFGHPAPYFYVSRKVPWRSLSSSDRIPPEVTIGGRRYRTDVFAASPITLSAAPIGNPTENQRSYRKDGTGTWKMGVSIRVQDRTGAYHGRGGTAGAMVKKSEPGAQPLLLSCGHVLAYETWDVVQCLKSMELGPPVKLNNHAGQTFRIANPADADAGLAEVHGATPEILHMDGRPRPRAATLVANMTVQKSGGETGLTYSHIWSTNNQFHMSSFNGAPLGEAKGIIFVVNHCPAATNPDPLLHNRFSFGGDSGALAVIGNPKDPADFGRTDLNSEYANAPAAKKAQIQAEYFRAAVGLIIGDNEITYDHRPPGASWSTPIKMNMTAVQDIRLALKGLDVELIT
jgi:hypothetical protein